MTVIGLYHRENLSKQIQISFDKAIKENTHKLIILFLFVTPEPFGYHYDNIDTATEQD